MKIRILPEGERDLDIAAEFYESQRPGAGKHFIRSLSRTSMLSSTMAARTPTDTNTAAFIG